jgi:hypothetical protein
MTKMMWGIVAPLAITAMALVLVFLMAFPPSIKWGITVGFLVALIQSFLSVGALRWAQFKKSFYWIWGGGIFFRMFIFAVMALLVYRFTNLNFVATMLSMVMATTLFLVIETALFMGKH